jgi:mono/diheme cytochrome c family protein
MRVKLLLNLALLMVLFGMIGLHWLILPDPSRPNSEFLPDMVESLAHDAQSPLSKLAGVSLDLRPPSGSIVRGFIPIEYPATPEGARLAGEELTNPFDPANTEAVERGAFVFNIFCGVCHGAAGIGNGSVTTRGVPPPPSFLLENALKMKDGQMFHAITFGQGNMASYAAQVQREDRWKAILYIRTLQKGSPAP